MKIVYSIIIVIVLIIAYYFYNVYDAVSKLVVRIGNPTKLRIESGDFRYTQELNITNNENTEIVISQINLIVSVDGKELGTCTLPSSQRIKANAKSIVKIDYRCSVLDLVQFLGFDIVSSLKDGFVKLNFKGTIGALNMKSTINETISLKLPTILTNLIK